MISEILQIEVSVAKSGFQHGADAVTAGRQGGNLRIECKRYQDKTLFGYAVSIKFYQTKRAQPTLLENAARQLVAIHFSINGDLDLKMKKRNSLTFQSRPIVRILRLA